MKKIIIASPTVKENDGIGEYSKIKNGLFNELNCKSDLVDISDSSAYSKFTELICHYDEPEILYIFLEFEINILMRERPIEELIKLFQSRNNNIYLIVMFHELWYKTNGNFIFKEIKSIVKREIIRKFIKKVKPNKSFTNSYYNKQKLKKLGVESVFLPVYSNIRVNNFNKTRAEGISWLNDKFSLSLNEDSIVGIFFGYIGISWKFTKTLNILQHEYKEKNKSISFLYVGPHGKSKVLENFKEETKVFADFKDLGLLSEEEVCLVLASSSFGFCVTPLSIASRSGSLAALLEEGLPLIVPDNEKIKNENIEKSGLDKDFFWDLNKIEKVGFPIRQNNSFSNRGNFRIEMAKKTLKEL